MSEKDEIKEIKALVKENNLTMGMASTMTLLKQNKCKKIWMSLHVESGTKEDIERYAGMQDVPVVQLSLPNDELGVICKKQFTISVVSLGEK